MRVAPTAMRTPNLRRALLDAQGEQPKDADAAEQQCDRSEDGGEDGDEALTAERLIELVAQRQEGHDAGRGRVTSERGAIGGDGFGVGLAANEEDHVVGKATGKAFGGDGEVERRRSGLAQAGIMRIFHQTDHTAGGVEMGIRIIG